MWFLNHDSPRLQARLGLDDLLAVGVQLDVVADAPAEGAGGVLDHRSGSFGPLLRFALARARVLARLRPDRAERGTFSQAPGRESCRASGVACTGPARSSPRRDRSGSTARDGGASEPGLTPYAIWLNLDFPPLRRRHAGAVGVVPHEAAGRRAVRAEDHALRDLAFLARERRLAVFRPHADRSRRMRCRPPSCPRGAWSSC